MCCVSASISPSTQYSHTSLGRVEQHCLSPPLPFYKWAAASLPEASKSEPDSSPLLCVVWVPFIQPNSLPPLPASSPKSLNLQALVKFLLFGVSFMEFPILDSPLPRLSYFSSFTLVCVAEGDFEGWANSFCLLSPKKIFFSEQFLQEIVIYQH